MPALPAPERAKSGGGGFAGAGSGHERSLDGAQQRAEAAALPAPGTGMSEDTPQRPKAWGPGTSSNYWGLHQIRADNAD